MIEFRPRSSGSLLVATALVAAALGCTSSARAASRTLFDFEGPYLVDPGRTIKDHSMVFDGTRWHVYHIRGDQTVGGTTSEIQIGHATTEDLAVWERLDDALTVDPGAWDTSNVWAPQVLSDPLGPGWRMFYTGVGNPRLQRMGAATSSDLLVWTKEAANPLLEPNPVDYWFDPAFAYLAALRDPYVFEEGGQYHVLNTALLRDASLQNEIRGAVHYAVSNDLETWTELPPLAENNSSLGVWREIESVQLIRSGDQWNLFFTLAFIEGVRWVSNDSLTTGWDIDASIEIDEGIAAELTPIDPQTWLFTRHAVAAHAPGHPDAGQIFYVLRADTLRFHEGAGTPVITRTDTLAEDWPTRSGTAFLAVPTFGDNSLERGDVSTNPQGHGHLNSREYYAGPLSGFGTPGSQAGVVATGQIESRDFTIAASDSLMRMLIAGTNSPDCRVELLEKLTASDGGDSLVVRRSSTGNAQTAFGPVHWDLESLQGSTCRMRVVDASTTGWIALDHVQFVGNGSDAPTSAPAARPRAGRLLANTPNPFNPRTELRFVLERPGHVQIELLDLRGRRLRTMDVGAQPAGPGSWVFDGMDDQGRALSSGVYLTLLRVDGISEGARKVSLVR